MNILLQDSKKCSKKRDEIKFDVNSAGKIDLYIERNRFHKMKELD